MVDRYSPPRGATTLFEVPFAGAMSGLDLALLERTLDLSIRMHAKMHPRPDSPAFVRLDHYSGLFLERGAAEGQWMLQARTWGHQHRRASTNGTWWPPAARTSSTLPSPFPSAYAPARPTPRTVNSDEPPMNVSPEFAVAWWGFNSVAG